MKRRMRDGAKIAGPLGWTVNAKPTGGNHLCLRHPQHGTYVAALSSSDWRAVHAMKGDLRRLARRAAA